MNVDLLAFVAPVAFHATVLMFSQMKGAYEYVNRDDTYQIT